MQTAFAFRATSALKMATGLTTVHEKQASLREEEKYSIEVLLYLGRLVNHQ